MPKLPIGDISTAEVIWDYASGGENLSLIPVHGTVKITMTDVIHDIVEDAFGVAAVDAVFGGTTMELEVPMTRSTLEQLGVALLGDVSGDVLHLQNKLGCDMKELAKPMVIKPICDGEPDTDPATWIYLFLCYPYRKLEINYAVGEQRVFVIGFKVFVNTDSPYVNLFGYFGMDTAHGYYE